MRVTIPTGQYANIQPEVEGIGTTFEEAQADALRKAASFYTSVDAQAELRLTLPEPARDINVPTTAPVAVAGDVERKMMADWFDGTKVFYDPAGHTYIDETGAPYISGSKFAHQYEPEFKKDAIIPVYAKKYDLHKVTVEELWAGKAEASTTWGTALHQALETYGKFWAINEKLGKDEFDGIPPYLRPLVAKFFTPERKAQDAVYEMFTASANTHRCGQLDRVVVVDRTNKIIDIEDYKTNKDMFGVDQYSKKLLTPYDDMPNMNAAKYTLQLSFYKSIAEEKGWSVRNLNLHWLTPQFEWQTIKLNPVTTNV